MKEMILAKKRENKGFTLMELLIVVAIIAVLVAIAIPMFTAQLEKSRDATDEANIRSAYAELSAAIISGDANAADAAALGLGSKWTGSLTNGSGTFTYAYSGKGRETGWEGGTTVTSTDIGGVTVDNKAQCSSIEFVVGSNGISSITMK